MNKKAIADKYLFYFATVRGVIGCTQCNAKRRPTYKLNDDANEITCMEWYDYNYENILFGNRKGYIKKYDLINDVYVDLTQPEGDGPIIGLSHVNKTLISGRSSGHVTLKRKKVVSKFKAMDNDDGTLERLLYNSNRNVLATGGENNDLKLWDLDKQKIVFKAKSMGHDELNLPIRASIRDITFINENLTSCVTKEGYVLLYDDRAQRRPISKYKETAGSYSCCASYGNLILAGTTKGYLQLIDLKQPVKCLKTFKCFTGGITGIACDSSNSIVATTSIDRHLRVHDVDTKELLHKEYLMQSVTRLLMKPFIKEEEEVENEVQQEKLEYDDLFDSMEVIADVKRKRAKRSKLT